MHEFKYIYSIIPLFLRSSAATALSTPPEIAQITLGNTIKNYW